MWIGTRSGLNLVQQTQSNQRASFKIYGSKDGFPNDVIHAIEEDQKGQLWISTNRGLIVFDPEAEQVVRKVYDKGDGLSNSSLVFRSSLKEENGTMYFGAPNGLNYFNPETIPFNDYKPTLKFTKLKVLNKVIKPNERQDAILQQSITYTNNLTLKHWQNIITLEFAALDFNRPEKNQYQYRLSSLNEDWVHQGNKNYVSFTNLSPGKHTLLIKGSNNDGLWSEESLKLVIHVLPPIWKTWWAYGIYALLFIGGIYWFIQFRIQQRIDKITAQAKLEKARLEEREMLRKKNAADFHDELGHRFTKIALFLELAKRQSTEDPATENYLDKIKKNTTGLSEGIRDLIWSLDPQKDSLYQTLIRLQEFGDHLFEFSDIHLKRLELNKP